MGGAVGSSSALQDKSSSTDQIGLWMAGLGPERGEGKVSSPKLGRVLDFLAIHGPPSVLHLVRGEGYVCKGQSLQHCFALVWASFPWILVMLS